jgi:hypothetical protein
MRADASNRNMRHTRIVLTVFLAASLIASAHSAQTAHQSSAAKKPKAAKKIAAKPPAVVEDWPVWGGKNRDFIVNTSGLADSWPAAGPKKVWSRTLGDGYSAVAEEGGILYTAIRRNSRDVITALDAATGKTIWEYEYENPFTNDYAEAVGPGPYAMPQVVGDRVVRASGTGKIHSLDKKTGKPKWSHDLYNEFHATQLRYGYSCHALPYKDTLTYRAGGEGDGVIAFRQSDGALVWKALQFTNSHSSPLLNPDLARQVQELLFPLPVRLDESWDLDHGTWSVLCHVYPQADISVVQLSIDETQPGSYHYKIGQRLAPLREEGVLIVGSGNLVHNLHAYAWGRHVVEPFDWAVKFERQAREMILAGDHRPLVDYERLGREARLSIPTPDHYLPLLYVIAARQPGEAVGFPVEGVDGGSISMLAVKVG